MSRLYRCVVGLLLVVVAAGGCGKASPVATRGGVFLHAADGCPAKPKLDVRARLSVGVGAGPVAVQGDSVWVARPRAGELVRASPRPGRMRLGGTPIALMAQPGRLWVALRDAGRVISIDTGTLKRVTTSRLPVPVAVAAGPLGVWALSMDTASLYQIDPVGGYLSTAHDAPVAAPADMVMVGEEIWVLGAGEQGLSPFNGHVGRIVRAGFNRRGVALSGLSSDAGSIWLAEPAERSLLRVNTANVTVHRFPAPSGMRPVLTAAGGCGVWVAGVSGEVTILDAQTGAPLAPPVSVGRSVGAIASAGNSVWISDPREGTLTELEAVKASS